MSEPKYCTDCVHHLDGGMFHARCANRRDLVTAAPVPCVQLRAADGECGPRGRLFVPRPPRRTWWAWLTGVKA